MANKIDTIENDLDRKKQYYDVARSGAIIEVRNAVYDVEIESLDDIARLADKLNVILGFVHQAKAAVDEAVDAYDRKCRCTGAA